MRVVGFTLVRNEEDVIEASIRHNLRFLDALAVVDHNSDDATPEILASLAREGLPIEVRRDDTLELRHAGMTTAGVRRVLAEGADLALPIDADEFVTIPSRERFERAVAAADPSRPLGIHSFTYLPDLDGGGDIVARLKRARRAMPDAAGVSKALVRRGLPDVTHDAHDTLADDVASIAHVPVRSAGQFTSKVAVGALAMRLAGQGDEHAGSPWQEAFDELVAGKAITPGRLASIAANYGVPRERRRDPASVRWTESPFLADIALRYTPDRPANPLARILLFGERVASEIARTTGGL